MIGEMRHYLYLQKRTLNSNEFGESVPHWKTEAALFAAIEPLAGREQWLAQQVQPDLTHRVMIYARDSVTPEKRFLWNTRILRIESVRAVGERQEHLECLCVEEV